jgi:hypothetical protein
MAFQKYTNAEKIDVVKPVENKKLNQKTAAHQEVKLSDLSKDSPGRDCGCPSPCSYCG